MITGPLIAVTPLNAVTAAAREPYVAARLGVVLVGLVTVTWAKLLPATEEPLR